MTNDKEATVSKTPRETIDSLLAMLGSGDVVVKVERRNRDRGAIFDVWTMTDDEMSTLWCALNYVDALLGEDPKAAACASPPF